MSFNPARMNGLGSSKRSRHLDPHAGLKHSQIVRSLGVQSVRVEDVRNRQDTAHGWRIPIYKGPTFEVEFQYMCMRNSTGRLRHDTKARCVRVLAGQLFVLVGDQSVMLVAHQAITLDPKVEYVLGTSGTGDAELYLCQDADYEKDLVTVSPSEAININPSAFAIKDESAPRERRADSMARQQAEEMAARKESRRTPMTKSRAPLPGQQVEGVNPRPIGASGYNEE